MNIINDEYYMEIAYNEALNAIEEDEVPVGCVIVIENKIIARAHNQVEKLNDPTAHAEMLCISSACEFLGTKFLYNSTLYVTAEPCKMCYGAIQLSRIPRIVYGVNEPKFGFLSSNSKQIKILKNNNFEQKIIELMKIYFKSKRNKI